MVVGVLVALVIPSLTSATICGSLGHCKNNLSELHTAVRAYRANNQTAPPVDGGQEASNWGMFLKDNGKGAGTLNNDLYFCEVMGRNIRDKTSDDGDYMFNRNVDGSFLLSEEIHPDTPIASDCISRNFKASNHGNPSVIKVNILLKDGSVRSVGEGDDLFERSVKSDMVGGSNTGNPNCPPPP